MPVGALALLLAPSGAEAALPASVAYTAASACAMTNAGTISARAAAWDRSASGWPRWARRNSRSPWR